MAWPSSGQPQSRNCSCGPSLIDFSPARSVPFTQETLTMKLRSIALAVAAVSALAGTTAAFAQAKEQFIPVLSYCTGAYAPNGAPWANGFVDYVKLVNARGGINGVKLTYEECETGYDTAKSVECYERLKSRGASFVQPLSTGATFAITEKAP